VRPACRARLRQAQPEDHLFRVHSRQFGDHTGADIVAGGVMPGIDAPETVTIEGITVWIHGNNADAPISAPEARELAQRLLEAADALERLEARP